MMDRIDALFKALDEITIAQEVTRKHDDARMNYTQNPAIETYEDYLHAIGEYYQYHYTTCVAIGGTLSQADAEGEAEAILQNSLKKDGMLLYHDAKNGTNGGLRGLYDAIADSLKQRSMRHYSQNVFSKHVQKENRGDCEEMCRQLIQKYGHLLGSDIDKDHPKIYADALEDIIFSIVFSLSQQAKSYRRVSR